MKGIDLETVFEIPTGPIQSVQCAGHHPQGFGKVRSGSRVGADHQATPVHHSLDGRERRE